MNGRIWHGSWYVEVANDLYSVPRSDKLEKAIKNQTTKMKPGFASKG